MAGKPIKVLPIILSITPERVINTNPIKALVMISFPFLIRSGFPAEVRIKYPPRMTRKTAIEAASQIDICQTHSAKLLVLSQGIPLEKPGSLIEPSGQRKESSVPQEVPDPTLADDPGVGDGTGVGLGLGVGVGVATGGAGAGAGA